MEKGIDKAGARARNKDMKRLTQCQYAFLRGSEERKCHSYDHTRCPSAQSGPPLPLQKGRGLHRTCEIPTGPRPISLNTLCPFRGYGMPTLQQLNPDHTYKYTFRCLNLQLSHIFSLIICARIYSMYIQYKNYRGTAITPMLAT